MRRKGFTLIELLIVVAIIAILAAIAVPNFLEAQTRSKVTRTWSDMRAVNQAFQMYVIDWQTPPSLGRVGWFALYMEPKDSQTQIVTSLTTPVAYMTAIPIDHFNSLRSKHEHNRTGSSAMSVIVTTQPYKDLGPGKVMNQGRFITFGKGTFHHWLLESVGPNLKWWHEFGQPWDPFNVFYDPSNGTISDGSLYWADSFGKGPPFQVGHAPR